MKQFQVLRVQCKKGVKISELFSIISQGPPYHDVFFELSGVGTSVATHATKSLKCIADYYHVVKKVGFSRTDRGVFSNLNSNWQWGNPNNTKSLNDEQLQCLIVFADRYGLAKYSKLLLGFDGIEWEPGHVSVGTYGYEKAASIFESGFNYLSNSVIISKEASSGKIMCNIACESQYRNTSSFRKMAVSLGETAYEKTFLAPENEQERHEFDYRYQKAAADYKGMIAGLPMLYRELEYPKRNGTWASLQAEREAPTLNTKKIADSFLRSEGWHKSKPPVGGSGISYDKAVGDGTLSVIIHSMHRGHMLQTTIYYRSGYFSFIDNINFSVDLLTEEESKEYFRNLVLVLAYIEAFLNDRKLD